MQLTQHQKDIGNNTISKIKSGSDRVVLQGSAGVGKTHLVAQLVPYLCENNSYNTKSHNNTVFVTAPTNKALSVLQKKIMPRNNLEFKTIHSALRMTRYINSKTGKASFIPSKNQSGNEFLNCKMCIVDESSMVNTEILNKLKDLKIPIVFVGDYKQINPIGETTTPVFNSGFPTYELTEIIRQGEGNPIIDLSRDIDYAYFKIPNTVDGKGFTFNDNKSEIYDMLAQVNGTDEVKYLSYTNNDVNSVNEVVRKMLYGNPNKIELGETIVFDSPYSGYFTNEEVKIEQLEVVISDFPIPKYNTKFSKDNYPINATDYIKLKHYRINNSFNIIHEHSEKMFNAIVITLTGNCKNLGWNWRGKFFFEEQFAKFKYNHAISIHKSQGSTYKNTILNVGSVNFDPVVEERQRLLYTGITRASDLLILNNVK